METTVSSEHKKANQQYTELLEHEPKLITLFVPKNAAEQKQLFLAGETRNPHHNYDKLADVDFDERIEQIHTLHNELEQADDYNPKHATAYEQFAGNYVDKNILLALAQRYHECEDTDEKRQLGEEFMRLNSELYGEPSETVYRSLLAETLDEVNAKTLSGRAAHARYELFGGMADIETASTERFKPSSETVEWMNDTAHVLYDGMLAHIPEQEMFTREELKTVLETIITDEFGESAAEWRVDIEPAKSMNVKATEKRIVIPDDYKSTSRKRLRELVVHEVGVHMLRSVIGGETDLAPLANGLSDYYDAEEGLGVVMEQALNGEYKEAGTGHYITAGMAYYDNLDFRGIFERKWRIAALSSLKDGEELTDEKITKAKNTAYGAVQRILRGTDELPWFKDLAYYNGAAKMWEYLESIRGDDIQFQFVLMGKADPLNPAHRQVQYETASR